jgi:hypothetical protein
VAELRAIIRDLRPFVDSVRAEYRRRCGEEPPPDGGEPPTGGGGTRTCEFGFDTFGNPRAFLIQFGCAESFRTAIFNFNAPIQSVTPGVGNAGPPICQIDPAENRRVRCVKDDSFAARTAYVFEIRTVDPQTCPAFLYVPMVEGQNFPEKNCRESG